MSVLWALLATSRGVQAQSTTSEPQASCPEEFDQFLDVQEASEPRGKLLAAQQFESAWPYSPLLGRVYRLRLEAEERIGEAKAAWEAGEKALSLAPGNLDLLAEIAYLRADSSSEPADLSKADDDAHQVIASSRVILIPHSVTVESWYQTRAALERKAHSALALVAFKRHNIPEAITEFQAASASGTSPDAALDYRLGVLYQMSGQLEKARVFLTRAAHTNESLLRSRAERQLGTLKDSR